MAEKTYTVNGMTCEHCVRAVRGELNGVAGIGAVAVDLASGQVTITGDGFSDEQVRAAVLEAGYEVA